MLGEPLVLLFKDPRVLAFLGLTIGVVTTIFLDRVDEEQREHFDSQGAEPLLFVEVLFDGPADHLPLDSRCVHITVGLTLLEVDRISRNAQLQEFRTLGGPDFSNADVGVDITAGLEVEPSVRLDSALPSPDTSSLGHIDLDLRSDDSLALDDGLNESYIGLVVGLLNRCGGDLDLLNELPLVGIHRVQFVDHVVLLRVSCGVSQRAERVHGRESFFAPAFQSAIDALGLVDDDHGSRRSDEIDRRFSARLLIRPLAI